MLISIILYKVKHECGVIEYLCHGNSQYFFFFNCLAALCSRWDVSHPARDELAPSELEVQDLNHWTTRDISSVFLLHGRKSLDAFTLFCNT